MHLIKKKQYKVSLKSFNEVVLLSVPGGAACLYQVVLLSLPGGAAVCTRWCCLSLPGGAAVFTRWCCCLYQVVLLSASFDLLRKSQNMVKVNLYSRPQGSARIPLLEFSAIHGEL
jgi:hypothetical protein